MDENTKKVMFGTGQNEWETPRSLWDEINCQSNPFVWDMAASDENHKCDQYFTAERSSLDPDLNWWELDGLKFCNPPYSRDLQPKFVAKAAAGPVGSRQTVMLLPARTDTKLFHQYIWNTDRWEPREGVTIVFLKGRLAFELNGQPILDKNGRPMKAPFPSMLVYFE